MSEETRVYVYGVLPAAEEFAASVAGVEGAPVRAVRHAELAALVSDTSADALAVAKEIRAHWQVLESVSAQATVLPVRFGTVMESESAVRDRLLEPNAERFRGLLAELNGRVQISLKATYDEERLLREVVRRSPAVAALREQLKSLPDEAGYYERIRLGELVAAEIARCREEDTRLALEGPGPLAASARPEAVTGSEAAFNLAFLVDRDRVDRFGSAVGELAKELGDRVRLRYVGPLPPYSFVDENLGPGGAAWA